MANLDVKVQSDSRRHIRFSLPSVYAQQYYGKKQAYISFGAKDEPANMLEAYQCRDELQKDLEQGLFDPQNVDKYKHSSKKVKQSYIQYQNPKLLDLYDQYTEYNAPNIAQSTLINNYQKSYRNSIKDCNDVNFLTPQGQLEIAQHLAKTRCKSTQVDVLSVLKRAIDFGKENSLIPANTPNNFESYLKKARKLPNSHRKQVYAVKNKERDPDKVVWTKEEMQIIIEGIESRNIQSWLYKEIDIPLQLIKVLFFTGMRHGEAFALRWGKVTWDVKTPEGNFVELLINQSYESTSKILKPTKNYKSRRIKLSQPVVDILLEIKSVYERLGIPTGYDDYIFMNSNLVPCRTGLIRDVWLGATKGKKDDKTIVRHGVVSGLVNAGKLPNYADAYSTRRTFASLQIQNGVDPRTVADYIGDSVKTVLKYYYRGKENFVPIVF